MSNFIFLEISKRTQKKIDNPNNFLFAKSFAFVYLVGDQILQIHFRTLHNNISISAAIILIDLELSKKISLIFDHVLTDLR